MENMFCTQEGGEDSMKRFSKQLGRFFATMLVAESVLQFVGPISAHAEGDIPVDADHFPDAGFRTVISQVYDSDHNGYLDDRERGVYNVKCEENKNVKSMDGIEYFPEVRGVWCKDCDIDHLDLSQNPKVVGVWCSGNPRLTSLSFDNNPDLEWVYCHDCDIRSLDVSHNPKIAYLEVNTNGHLGEGQGGSGLHVENCPNLEHLTCGNCNLGSLDLTHCPRLTHLDAFGNGFQTLDLTHNTKLQRIDIWKNDDLGNMDFSIFPDLTFLNCGYNGMTELDVTHNPNLMMLVCNGNQELRSLDLTHNDRLAWLRCMNTSVSSLDLSNCPQLYFCQVAQNPNMGTLDISNNTRLIKIMRDGHQDYSERDSLNNPDVLINYGGSTDYMDDRRFWFGYDDNSNYSCTIVGGNNAVTNGDPDYYDCYINTNDVASGDLVTRGEAIQTLYELAGRPSYNGGGRFTDVDGEFYEAAAKWGADHNIALGYPNIYSDTFAGDKPISKQDLAVMVHSYALAFDKYSAYDYGRSDHWEDSLDIDFYAWGAFTYAIQWQIVQSYGDNVYPHGRMTTAEFETGLQNFCDKIEIAKTVSVCTSGGSGTLEASDINNNRHRTNHSPLMSQMDVLTVDPNGTSGQSTNSGSVNTTNTNSDPQRNAEEAVNNVENIPDTGFVQNENVATVTQVATVEDDVRGKFAKTAEDLIRNNDDVSGIDRIYMADVTLSGNDGSRVNANLGSENAGKTAYAYRYNGNEWELNGVIEINNEGYAEDDFDGFSHIAFVVIREKSSGSSSGHEEKPAHVHKFAWVVTEQPSNDRLGLELYRCEACGKVLDERNIDNQANLFKEIRMKVNNAPENATVSFEMGGYISLNKILMETLEKRSDVTVNFKFTYKGKKYDMTIPAGFQWGMTLNDSGWAGFMYIGSFPEVTLTEVQ